MIPFRNLLRLFIRNVGRSRLRFTLTLLGVVLGTSLFVSVTSINEAVREVLDSDVRSLSAGAPLNITSRSGFFYEDVLERARAVAGVERASGTLESKIQYVRNDGSVEPITVLGIDLLAASAMKHLQFSKESRIDDPLVFLNQPDSIVLNREFAARNSWKLDSKVRFRTVAGMRTFTVRGLVDPVGIARAFGGKFALMDIDGARRMFDAPDRLNRVDLYLKPERRDDASVNAIRAEVQSALGSGYIAERPEVQSEQLGQLVRGIQALQSLISVMGLLVGGVIVFITIRMSVIEQRKSLALFRCIGATRSQIFSLVLIEAIAIGILGSLIGIVLSPALTESFLGSMLDALETGASVRPEGVVVSLTLARAAIGLGVGVFVSCLAAFAPARRAARIQPLEGLTENSEPSVSSGPGRASDFRGTLAIGGLLLGFSLVSARFAWSVASKPVNYVTRLGLIVGPALICVYLTFAIVGWLDRKRFFARSVPLGMGLKNILAARGKLASTVVLLAIGIGFMMLVNGISESFETSATEWAEERYRADFTVVSTLQAFSGAKNPFSASIGRSLLATDGVRKFDATREGLFSRSIHYLYRGKKIRLLAIDHPPPFAELQYQYRDLTGEKRPIGPEFFGGREQILISENFRARNRDIDVGSELVLDTPKGSISFRVAGIFREYSTSAGAFLMAREVYERLWKDPTIDEIQLFADPHLDPSGKRALEGRLQARIGIDSSLQVWSNDLILRESKTVLNRSFRFSRAIEKVTLLIILFGLTNTFLAHALGRTREIGLLRAIGATSLQIWAMVLGEAFVLSGLVGTGATMIGSVGAYTFLTYTVGPLFGWVVDYRFRPVTIAAIILTAIAVSLLASLYPTRRILRSSVVGSLR